MLTREGQAHVAQVEQQLVKVLAIINSAGSRVEVTSMKGGFEGFQHLKDAVIQLNEAQAMLTRAVELTRFLARQKDNAINVHDPIFTANMDFLDVALDLAEDKTDLNQLQRAYKRRKEVVGDE